VQAEADLRRRKKADYQGQLQEKQESLARLSVEFESLMKVKQEQELLISKLSDSGS
jgi:intraflagellar transport protein 20